MFLFQYMSSEVLRCGVFKACFCLKANFFNGPDVTYVICKYIRKQGPGQAENLIILCFKIETSIQNNLLCSSSRLDMRVELREKAEFLD